MKMNLMKSIAAFSTAALFAASANAIVIDISSVGDSGLAFAGDSTASFFANSSGYVFEVNNSDGLAGDARGLLGMISGVWSFSPSGNVSNLSGATGSFVIDDGAGDMLTADLDLSKIGTVLSGGVITANLSNLIYAGANMDLMEMFNAGAASLSLSYEIARGPSNLTLDYLANNEVESTFSGDLSSNAISVPDGGTTAAMLGFGFLLLAAAGRRKAYSK